MTDRMLGYKCQEPCGKSCSCNQPSKRLVKKRAMKRRERNDWRREVRLGLA